LSAIAQRANPIRSYLQPQLRTKYCNSPDAIFVSAEDKRNVNVGLSVLWRTQK
jgi:hypothetical protein